MTYRNDKQSPYAAYKTPHGWITRAPWYIRFFIGGSYRLSREPQLFSNERSSDQRFVAEAIGFYESNGYTISKFDLVQPRDTD